MDWTTSVTVHESALPETMREEIAHALHEGELHPSLLYSGLRQTQRWIHLHRSFSPAQRDPGCAQMYASAFSHAVAQCKGNVAHLVSLACGDGTKDTRCLQLIHQSGRAVIYTPADISLEMVLTAERTAASAVRGLQCTPLLCDLPHCQVLPALLKQFDPSGAERLLLFLGTIHNYWPPEILRSLLYPLRSQDQLLISANLRPSSAPLEQILPQYDNALTRDWLMGALSELDLTPEDGTLSFSVTSAETIPSLNRVEANFTFFRARKVRLFDEEVSFAGGRKLRVFYSWRFSSEQITDFLTQARLRIDHTWVSASGEEGLFLCRRV